LRYGSHVRRTRLRITDCSAPALDWLPDERAIYRMNSFQFTRSARLGLAHQINADLLSSSHPHRTHLFGERSNGKKPRMYLRLSAFIRG
jgi:hypothetical protein